MTIIENNQQQLKITQQEYRPNIYSKESEFSMLSEDYDAISNFLKHNVYPTDVLKSKKIGHAKKNFRVKASQYVIGEASKIFKVSNILHYFLGENDAKLIMKF